MLKQPRSSVFILPHLEHARPLFMQRALGAMSNLFYLFGILSLFSVIIVNSDATPQRPYRNLYGTENPPFLTMLPELVGGLAGLVQEAIEYQAEELPDVTPKSESSFDFIVIGAGTAGATIASRLSELNKEQVLLIEAGSNENLLMDVPMAAPLLQLSDKLNWMYQTEPSDKYCLGLKNHRCNWPRGKVMGGSSVLNMMIATRGSPYDYDRWAELGNPGWSYEEVLPYFKKLENILVPELINDTELHNTKGPVSISYTPFHTPLAKPFLNAGKELGYPIVDYNGRNMIGFSLIQTTTRNGERMSSNRAYLHPIKHRTNLCVSQLSTVSKILIDRVKKRAIGVEFIKDNKKTRVYARKEVILSAGAIGSPQILMLSGIGHSKHLKRVGIDVVKELPVGDNLMDHIAFGGLQFLVNETVAINLEDFFDLTNPYIRDYLWRREGPFSSNVACDALGFIDTDNPKNRQGAPNIELLFISTKLLYTSLIQIALNLDDKIRDANPSLTDKYGWTILPMILRPKSRGWLRLATNDVKDKPKIVANYLADPDDVRVMIAGIRAAINISQTESMKTFESVMLPYNIPDCEIYKYDSDAYWECAIRYITFNIYHYSGTCKMGPKDDPTSVVNHRLKV